METLSKEILGAAKVVVLKIGSALLVQNGALHEAWLKSIAEDVAMLKAQGKAVLVVSSGAIALGARGAGLAGGGFAARDGAGRGCRGANQTRACLSRGFETTRH